MENQILLQIRGHDGGMVEIPHGHLARESILQT